MREHQIRCTHTQSSSSYNSHTFAQARCYFATSPNAHSSSDRTTSRMQRAPACDTALHWLQMLLRQAYWRCRAQKSLTGIPTQAPRCHVPVCAHTEDAALLTGLAHRGGRHCRGARARRAPPTQALPTRTRHRRAVPGPSQPASPAGARVRAPGSPHRRARAPECSCGSAGRGHARLTGARARPSAHAGAPGTLGSQSCRRRSCQHRG